MPNTTKNVIELFAGVGGFRLGLEKSGWETIWNNQWEPSTKRQHASEVYGSHFGTTGHANCDLTKVDTNDIPDHDLLVGGFPCQDYSVAKPLNQSNGINGKKGVLWWDIYRILQEKRPKYVLLENVNRLLSSPAKHRGRDFGIILACFQTLGYVVEWRIVNAADYGYPQRRKRLFILAYQAEQYPTPHIYNRTQGKVSYNFTGMMVSQGMLAAALPAQVVHDEYGEAQSGIFDFPGYHRNTPSNRFPKDDDNILDYSYQKWTPEETASYLHQITEWFEKERYSNGTPFMNAGIFFNGRVLQEDVKSTYKGYQQTLETILQSNVPEEFYLNEDDLERWTYLKGAKNELRTHKDSGETYTYSEGAVTFPDALDKPSRTIITGEGGTSPSRFKHVIQDQDGKYRRLTPIELERLNGFPDEWTFMPGISDTKRAFLMGKALVVGIVERIGQVLAEQHELWQQSSMKTYKKNLKEQEDSYNQDPNGWTQRVNNFTDRMHKVYEEVL